MSKIENNSILTATSVCDSNCVWTAKVIERKGDFIKAEIDGQIVRKKVKVWNGEEYALLLGSYSMAPIFKVKN
jgi:hypothetical protein